MRQALSGTLEAAGIAMLSLGLVAAVPAQEPSSTPSFGTEAAVITVDVVVLGDNGEAVRGLGKDDFVVREDGRPQAIVAFEARELAAAGLAPAGAAPRVATNQGAGDGQGRPLVFILDDLGLDTIWNGRAVKMAVARWLEERADPRDDVTIATTSGEVWWNDVAGQGRSGLLAALERVQGKKMLREAREVLSDWEAFEIVAGGGLGGVSSQTGAIAASRGTAGVSSSVSGPPTRSGQPERAQAEYGGSLGRVVSRWSIPSGACARMTPEMCAMLVQARAQEIQDRTQRRQRALLRLVARVSQALADRRGRKSIVLFSEGFIEIPPLGPEEAALDAARRANVAVYFVDARGLVPLPFYDAEQAGPPDKDSLAMGALDVGVLSVAGADKLVGATGGALFQSNDVVGSVTRAVEDSSSYYLLGYELPRPPDGKWHDLKVAVSRPGVRVRARRGYYATPDAAPAVAEANASSSSSTSQPLVEPLLVAGGDRDAIPLRLVCRPLASGADGVRVLVGLDIGAPALSFPEDGSAGATIDVTLLSVQVDRPQPESFAQRVTLKGDGASGGPWWAFTHELVLAPGAALVKALVRDVVSGKTGTVTQRLDVPAQVDGPPGELRQRAAAFHFEPRDGKRATTILIEIPVGAREGVIPAEPAHLALVARIEDESGASVEELTRQWLVGGGSPRLQARVTTPLSPGRYTLASSVIDFATGDLGVTRLSFEVPPAGGVALSSLIVPGEGTLSDETTAGPPDPFTVGPVAFLPRFDAPIIQGTPELPLLLRIYPGGSAPLAMTIEVHHEGRLLTASRPQLPAPDADGRIAWLGSLPLASAPPGRYGVVARVEQAGATVEERVAFEIAEREPALSDAGAPREQDPEVAALLEKAGRYVVEYAQAFSNLVAEELYVQAAQAGVGYFGKGLSRSTRADVAFVVLGGPFVWGSFRDVFEVDGEKVRDREARLEKLLAQQDSSAMEKARAIRDESARHNIGLGRNINEPTLPLMFLHPTNQRRFQFARGARGKVAGRKAVELSFKERGRPTMVRLDRRDDLPAEGRFWLDAETGAVLTSEVTFAVPTRSDGEAPPAPVAFASGARAESRGTTDNPVVDSTYGVGMHGVAQGNHMMDVGPGYVPRRAGRRDLSPAALGRVSVEYRAEPGLAIWVPYEMRELYPGTEARAVYSNYRRFSVETMEALQGPKRGGE